MVLACQGCASQVFWPGFLDLPMELSHRSEADAEEKRRSIRFARGRLDEVQARYVGLLVERGWREASGEPGSLVLEAPDGSSCVSVGSGLIVTAHGPGPRRPAWIDFERVACPSSPAGFSAADIPVAPSHLVWGECSRGLQLEICVLVPGEVSRNDGQVELKLVETYAERFKAAGWRQVSAGGWSALMASGGRRICIEGVLWDDGRSARIRYQEMLRVTRVPEGVACGDGAEP
jgi:hypothetical protein